MKPTCQHVQDLLLDRHLGVHTDEAVAQHLSECADCRNIQQDLQQQDEWFTKFVQANRETMDSRIEKTIEALNALPVQKPQNLSLRKLSYAVAAILLVGLLAGMLWLVANMNEPVQEIVKPPKQQQIQPEGIKQEVQTANQDELQKEIPGPVETTPEQELQLAKDLFDVGNVQALEALYKAGRLETRQAVKNYLQRIGTDEAMEALSQLEKSASSVQDDKSTQAANVSTGEKEAEEMPEEIPADDEKSDTPKVETVKPEDQDWYEPDAEDFDNWQAGVLGIQVVDDQTGKPVGGADLEFRISPKTDIPKKAKTNQFGRYELKYYNLETNYLSVKVRTDQFCNTGLRWDPRSSGRDIPLQYQIRLKKGADIGGIVQTVDGQPLADVRIDFSIYYPDDPCVELPFVDDKDLITDQDGRWELKHFSKDIDPDGFGISLEHPEYVSVEKYSIRPSLESLFDKSCVMQMRKGITVRGQVTNIDGQPIEGAEIFTGSSRYSGDKEKTKTDAQGWYEFTNCKAHEMLLTVKAKGYAPDLREINVKADRDDIHFQLQPGYTVTVKVTDQEGNGIKGVKVEGDEWRFYNGGRQEARSIRCSAKTNAMGIATLKDLPADEVRYVVRKQGYAHYNGYSMTARDKDFYEIVLLPEGKLTGRVIDAETGLQVYEFQMTEGIQWRKQSKPTWQSMRRKKFTDGIYHHPLYYQDLGLAVKIEAEGYLPAESQVYINEGTELVEDILLYKGEGPAGIVYLPNGEPAHMAHVYVRNDDYYLNIHNGRVSRRGNRTVSGQTDEEGRFRLPVAAEPYCLVALHEMGIATVSHKEFIQTGEISLAPWGAIEGKVYLNNKPASKQTLILHPSFQQSVCDHIGVTNEIVTDENGWFRAEKIFPGRVQISRSVPLDGGGQRYINTRFVQLEPGQTASITIGKDTRSIMGRLNLPGNMRGDSYNHVDLTVRVNVDLGSLSIPQIEIPENFFLMNEKQMQQWQQELQNDPEYQKYLKELQEKQSNIELHEPVILSSDGTFRAENIPPGTYQIRGTVGTPGIDRHTQAWYENRIGKVRHTFTVPEAKEDTDYQTPVDIGTVTAEPLLNIQAGKSIPEFEMTGLKEQPLSLNAFAGKYLLIDLGGPMPGQSVYLEKTLPILKEVFEEYHENKRLNILTVTLNYIPYSPSMNKAFRYFIEKQQIDWSVGQVKYDYQNPESSVTAALVEGRYFPSLLLVAPDGTIAAVKIKPEKLRETIEKFLPPEPEETPSEQDDELMLN